MTNPVQHPIFILPSSLRGSTVAVVLLCVILTQSAQEQTFTVLHNFTGGADGGTPYAPVTVDGRGDLYGTTSSGGSGGVVFKMTHTNGAWTFGTLYSFGAPNDPVFPYAGVVFGPDGTLYGTGSAGGTHGAGAVFNLQPPPHFEANVFAPWTETVLYSFEGGDDGLTPYASVTFDRAGNIYGTTYNGGAGRQGTVYKLTRSGGGWTESVLYNFAGSNGQGPIGGVIIDNAGNLYGTTQMGGLYQDFGEVYELTYAAPVGWTESFLYSFDQNGPSAPTATLMFGPSGNIYGTTASGEGSIFDLTPSGSTWIYHLLYGGGGGIEECGDRGGLAMDAAGNFYGTTTCDGAHGSGSVFKLSYINGVWTSTTLYSFTGGSDGEFPEAGPALDANGNLYGTTTQGGAYGNGVVWEVTP